MKRAKVGMIATAVLAVATMAFAQKTDFSGTWTPDTSGAPAAGAPAAGAPAAGAPAGGAPAGGGAMGGGGGRGMTGPMTVKQTGDTLTVETEGRNGPQTRTYKLDGSEVDMPMGQMTAKVSAKWDGPKLVITTKTDQGEQTQTWSLAGGVLTIDRTGRPRPVVHEVQEDHLVFAARGWRTPVRQAGKLTLPGFFFVPPRSERHRV